jgi:hypothetical protein
VGSEKAAGDNIAGMTNSGMCMVNQKDKKNSKKDQKKKVGKREKY